MRHGNCRILLSWVFSLIVCVVLVGGQQASRGPPPETADDSARWWTLTDEITPEELRAIHEDVELHQERYREAVRAGTEPLLPKARMELLRFFIDGDTHPELFQMWSVYGAFAIRFEYDEEDPRVSLVKFGFKPEVAETIADLSLEYWRKRDLLWEKGQEDIDDLHEFVRLSKERVGEKGYRIAGKTRDAAKLAIATGYSVEKVEEYLKRIWEETPIGDLTRETLPLIKEALKPADWELFRQYLLEVQAPRMHSKGYSEGKD